MVDAAPPESRCGSPGGLRFLPFNGTTSAPRLFVTPVPHCAADCHGLFAGDAINSCVCTLKL